MRGIPVIGIPLARVSICARHLRIEQISGAGSLPAAHPLANHESADTGRIIFQLGDCLVAQQTAPTPPAMLIRRERDPDYACP